MYSIHIVLLNLNIVAKEFGITNADLKTSAKMIGTIMSHFDRGNAKIYELTDAKSQEQRDQHNNFVRIINRQAIPIFCFYETHKSDLVRIIRASPFKKVSRLLERSRPEAM